MGRRFLAVFLLDKPQPEHARIKDAIAHHSDGDYKLAFTHGAGTVAYLFSSNTHPRDMGFGVLNQDSYLVVEVGDVCSEQHLNVAASWIYDHRTRP